MIDEEKRYKILKKESYKRQMKEEEIRTIANMFLFGIQAVCATYLLCNANDPNFAVKTINDVYLKSYEALTGSVALGMGAYHLYRAITAIGEKTLLELKIENIDVDFDEFDNIPVNEESKGVQK